MTRTNTPTVDEYWEALAKHLPTFSPEDQRVAVTLYRELAKGQPVDAAQLGRALGVAPAEARGFLNRDSIKAFVYPDDKGRVLGFGDRKSTRLNSSHDQISYAVFCLKKKKKNTPRASANTRDCSLSSVQTESA